MSFVRIETKESPGAERQEEGLCRLQFVIIGRFNLSFELFTCLSCATGEEHEPSGDTSSVVSRHYGSIEKGEKV